MRLTDAVTTAAPVLVAGPALGIGDWSEGDIVMLVKDGLKPDYDNVQGSMAEAIENGLKHLSEADLKAIAHYLKALPPIQNKIER